LRRSIAPEFLRPIASGALLLRRVAPMAVALGIGGFALSLAPRNSVGPPWALVLLALGALGWVLSAPRDTRRDELLPALSVMLTGLGLAMLARLSGDLAHKQEAWIGISLTLVLLSRRLFDHFRQFAAFKYVWVLGSIVLFALIAIFGQEVNGAKLWIRIGSIQFEPVEIIKLFMVLFMAAYLAETADVIAAAKPWSVRANAKYLGPLFLGWGASMLLVTFVAMLYVATRRVDLVLGGAAVFALAAWWAVKHYPYVVARFQVWQNPFADPLGRGYQALQALFSLAAGGLFGTGYGLGHPYYIPAVGTDYIYAAWSEEFGALGGLVLIGAFLVVVQRGLAIAQAQPDLYAKLLATGLAVTLGVQTFIIIGGVLGLLPLTGITLPFISYGGSSLVANFLLIALVWAIGSERAASS
jgi:cell division protein FtsW